MRTNQPKLTAVIGAIIFPLTVAACGTSASSAAGSPSQPGAVASPSSAPASGARAPVSDPASGSGASPADRATPSLRLSGIAFASPRDGHGLFLEQGAVRCRYVVGRTSDGGVRFTAMVAVTSWSCNQNSPAHSLAFDRDGDGFLYGPRLFVTHNAGATWTATGVPDVSHGSVLSVAAAGRSFWMLAASCTSGAQRCHLRLIESGNGGRSWHLALAQPPGATASRADSFSDDNPAAGQAWLLRTGPASGYVLSRPALRPGRVTSVPLWFTSDGGASWSRLSAPCGVSAIGATASVARDGTLFVACAGEPTAGSQAKSIARSVDAGRSWTVHRWCPDEVLGCPPLNSGYLGQIEAVSASTAFLVGGRASLMVTRDGGARWSMVRPQMGDQGGGTSQVIFFNRSDGLVLGDDGADNELPALWHTSDGGVHWTAVAPAAT